MLAGSLVTLFVDLDVVKGDRVTTLRRCVRSEGALLKALGQGDWVRVIEEQGDAYYATIEGFRGDLIDLRIDFDFSEPKVSGIMEFGTPEVSASHSGTLTAA